MTSTSGDWLDLGRGERLDRAHLDLEDAYGPLLWRGAPVDGVVYFFDPRGVCLVEEAYEAGQPADTARREWYPSGAPKALLRGDGGAAWFENGGLQAKLVDRQTLLNLVVRDDGSLGAIVLHDPALFDVATVQPLTLSSDLLLTGHGIDDRLLATLRDTTKLGAVSRLRLIDTAIGRESIELLASLPELREVWLAKNRSLDLESSEDLTRRRPDCIVHYEAASDT